MNPRFPDILFQQARRLFFDARLPGYLGIYPDGTLAAHGGNLDLYGLGALQDGQTVFDTAFFLEGLIPLLTADFALQQVQMPSGAFADVHGVKGEGLDWVLLLDATREVDERALFEQAFRSVEEKLRQAERLEVVGRLAGGVAHDFNNLLTVIIGYSDIALSSVELPASVIMPITEVRKAADRAALLTRQLLAISRRQVNQPKSLSLHELIVDSAGMLRRLLGEDVQIVLGTDPNLPKIMADPGQIQQVLLNLAVNARDAMTDGGVLTIETSQAPAYSAPPGEGAEGAANRRPQVYLRVTDSGTGMDEETLSHIFEPFFTTKPLGRGTGLGLATVHGIVTQAGGSISVRSQPGKGATFEVCFPASFTEEETSDSHVQSVNAGSRGETILLAEDDLAVRHFVSRQIQDLGYQLLEAKDAEEAIRTAASYRGPIDLLVTDVVMPNMSGIRLAEVLCQQRAEMRVLFMSGYSQEIVNRGNRTGELPFLLQKPFSPAALSVAIREAILRRKVTASATV